MADEKKDGVWRTMPSGARVFFENGKPHKRNIKKELKKQQERQKEKYNKIQKRLRKQFGIDKSSVGLGSANNVKKIPMHDKPIELEKIQDLSENNIKKILEKYESKIFKDKIENAIVITTNGEVYQCFGTKDGVYPDVDLGSKIRGGYITHNHPIEETYYGFSKRDNNLFEKYNLNILRGIDEEYIYEYNRLKPCNSQMPTDYNVEYGLEHLRSIEFAKENNIYYDRWENK